MRISFSIGAVAVFMALHLVGCDEQTARTPVSVKLNWQHGSDFIGFYVAQQRGYYADEGIETAIDPLSDPFRYRQVFNDVVDGKPEFSIAGGSLADAQASGLPLVAIANISKFSPATLFARKESNIATPANLEGKRVAIKNDSWRQSIASLLGQFGLTLDDIVEIPSGYDMKPFYEGKVDVWAGFIQDEPVRARLAGLDIVTLPFHEYGQRGTALTIFTSHSLLKSQPDLAAGFVRATLRGWQWAIDNPGEAVNLMIEARPELAQDRPYHLASLHASIPLILPAGAQLGAIDCQVWQNQEVLALLDSREATCTDRIFAEAMAGRRTN